MGNVALLEFQCWIDFQKRYVTLYFSKSYVQYPKRRYQILALEDQIRLESRLYRQLIENIEFQAAAVPSRFMTVVPS